MLGIDAMESEVDGFITVRGSGAGVQVYTGRLPEGKTSPFWAIFLVVNAALGAGLLTFPLSFYMTGGIVSGIIIELVLICFVVGGVLVLVYSAELTQSPTYETTVEAVCGPVVRVFAELCLMAFCFGSNITYLVVIGDQLEDVTTAFDYDGRPLSQYWWMNRKLLITVTSMLFIFPMLFFRRIGVLSYTSFLSVLCCFYIATIITVRYFHPFSHPSNSSGGDECGGGIPCHCSRGVPDVILAIPFICFGYQCHVSSIPVYTDMKNRSFKSFLVVIIPSIFICFCVYTTAGVFGLLRFDPDTCIASDILRNYHPRDIPIDVARGVLAVVIITSYPILTFCGRTALDSMVMNIWSQLKNRFSSPEETAILSPKPLIDEAITKYSCGKCSCSVEGIRLRVESMVWFFSSLLLALYVPAISDIVSFTGGLAASFIFLFPGLILLKLTLRTDLRYSTCQRVCFVVFGCVIIVIGTFIFGLSVVYTIMSDAKLL